MSNSDTESSGPGSKLKVIKLVVFIGLMLLILVEARAKMAYSAAISGLDTLLEKSADESTLEAVDEVMTFFPSKALVDTGETTDLYLYSWASLLNYGGYKISVYASKSTPQRMLKFKLGVAKLETIKPMSEEDARPLPPGGINFGGQ
ncbi:MAG: hypothetical protein ABJZ55_25605 [Fuerstiella sp.]